jgi:hypothetical protein
MALTPEIIVGPGDCLSSVFNCYLFEKIIKMRFNRILADKQRAGDFNIGCANAQLIQNLFFPVGQQRRFRTAVPIISRVGD